MKRTPLAAMAAWAVAGSAATAATMTCSFTRECVETESCAETRYAVSVEDMQPDGRAVTLVTDSDTLRGTVIETDGPLHMIFTGDSAVHLLTTRPGGAARLSVHMPGPMAVGYHGTCEAPS